MSEPDMREWLDHTVRSVLELAPLDVLEIGCGAGLLLFRIAPRCERYWATDLSSAALRYVAGLLRDRGLESRVRLLERPAHDLDDLEGSFDCVVLNSVIQYFPGVDYLLRVLKSAARLLRPGGTIFVGDVRSLPLLEAHHLSIELERASPATPLRQLRQRVHRRMEEDNELVVDPELFQALPWEIPVISRVQVQPKRGRRHNELTRFRFDVVLHTDSRLSSRAPDRWLDWSHDQLDIHRIVDLAAAEQPNALGVTGVPNARLGVEAQVLDHLDADSEMTVGQLRELLQHQLRLDPDPEDLWSLERQGSYQISVTWSPQQRRTGHLDAALVRRIAGDQPVVTTTATRPQTRPVWARYANDPLHGQTTRALATDLRSHLRQWLPDYLVPDAFVVLDKLPLTANGKLDRRALPEPDQARPAVGPSVIPPRGHVEQVIADVWRSLLRVRAISIVDNLFELGANSLMVVQAQDRMQQILGTEISMVEFFRYPTIASLSEHLSEGTSGNPERPGVDHRAAVRRSRLPERSEIRRRRASRIQP
jgi:SAM-dependent methyltransferase